MKQILFCLIMLFAGNMLAQDNAIDRYFEDFQKQEDFTKVSVTSKMFSLFTEIDTDDEDEQALLEAMSKIKGIRGLIYNDADNGNTMYKAAIAKVKSDGAFEELMSVEDPNENVQFLIRDENGQIHELLMVRSEKREFMVMSVYGDIDLNAIGRLSKVMKVRGMEGFGDLDGDH